MKHIIARCMAIYSHIRNLIYLIVAFAFCLYTASADAIVPRPDHVVICMLENHGYPQIVGSTAAPYINQLAATGANLQEFYAITHPSQPNYIMLFAGNNFGVTTDALPSGTPWSYQNLGSLLINHGFSFAGYSEDLPSMGSNIASLGAYARKHNPWANWQGSGTNQLPASTNLPLSQWPNDFNQLPDVSFVIPNLDNDMHNGSDPARITTSDTWVRNHLAPYVNWAMNNNSLFILIFDEDNNYYQNRIPCILAGPMVQSGNYGTIGYNHYDMLRTIEDMFGLPYAGNSASAHSIQEVWDANATGISSLVSTSASVSISPNPVQSSSIISVNGIQPGSGMLTFVLYDILGNKTREFRIEPNTDLSSIPFDREGLRSGVYFFRLLTAQKILSAGKVVLE